MSGRGTALRPDRIRTIEKPFAWIPFRLVTDGTFAALSDPAKLLYIFLCLAADRQGMSFYGDARLGSFFDFHPYELELARQQLIAKDLIAYDGHLYQVLSLPPPPAARRTVARHCAASNGHAAEPELFADVLRRVVKPVRCRRLDSSPALAP
jgi:hypothetical protein